MADNNQKEIDAGKYDSETSNQGPVDATVGCAPPKMAEAKETKPKLPFEQSRACYEIEEDDCLE